MSSLQKKREELVTQQKQAEMNFHQVTGAIAVVDQMIDEEKNNKEEGKTSGKK
jgi:hypothetical protein